MRTVLCEEGEPFSLDPALHASLRVATLRIRNQIHPRFPILSENGGSFIINGIVGSIDLGSGIALEVSPKTESQADWIHAVLELLVGKDRIDASGERAAGLSPQRRNLLDALAAIYAARLRQAINRDGPILLLRRQHAELSHLKGKLLVTQWLRHAAWQPHRMPVTYSQLTSDHDFSRGLTSVAHLLASATQLPRTKGSLLQSIRELRPGHGEDVSVSRNVASLLLPSQWAVYKSAWSIASAVLSQRSLLGSKGSYQGISIAIEAWPLLERLLERSLSQVVRIGHERGYNFSSLIQQNKVLLDEPSGPVRNPRYVKPDGLLMEGENVVASFEAKYKRRKNDWPEREDLYQALATAAACNSPLAVLVYPETFPTAMWRVRGFNDTPRRLVAMGLGLYSYRAGIGDVERGERILDLLDDTQPEQNFTTP